MTQKECVYERVCEIAKHYGIPIDTELGSKIRQDVKLKATIACLVQVDFEKNRVHMSDKFMDRIMVEPRELGRYVKGLVNNWLVKDNRLAPPYVYQGGRPLSTVQGEVLCPEARAVEASDMMGYPTMTEVKVCECGAKHTSSPLHHMVWCPMHS